MHRFVFVGQATAKGWLGRAKASERDDMFQRVAKYGLVSSVRSHASEVSSR